MAGKFAILVIDDDPAIVEFLTQASRQEFPEATFLGVSSVNQATTYLDTLEGKAPQLILLDINLSDSRNGLEFLTLLRHHHQGRLLPVVVLSATDNLAQIQQGYALGAAAITRKPFGYEEWKQYARDLRTYWYQTVTIYQLWHGLNL